MPVTDGSPAHRYVRFFMFPVLMIVILIATYIPAMRAPQPHELPIAVVNAPADASAAIAALIETDGDRYDIRFLDDAETAREAVQDQSIAAALVFQPAEDDAIAGSTYLAAPAVADPEAPSAVVYLASAAGTTRASAGLLPMQNLALELGIPLNVRDLVPLDSGDSGGIGGMFFAMAATLAGFISITTLASAAPSLLRPKPLGVALLAFGSIASLWIWIMTHVIVGAVDGPFLPLFITGLLTVMAAGFAAAVFTRLIGPLAVLLSLFVFIALGMTSSDVSVPMELAPGLYQTAHEFLTLPASAMAVRDIMYFERADLWSEWGVLVAWIVVMAGALELINRWKERAAPPTQESTEPIEEALPDPLPVAQA